MSKSLDVYLNQNLVGNLVQDKHGQMTFTYASEWLSNRLATPLSQSLPLQKESFRQKQCRGYFAGILPEENKRDLIAHNLGISAKNDFAMLERIGGECAGAVTFIKAGENLPTQSTDYRLVDDEGLLKLIDTLPTRPLMAGIDGIRLSLAGAQDKIAVHVKEGKVSIPLGGAPTTHILKPANERFKGVVFNEAFCLNLASLIGIPAARADVHSLLGKNYLLVERYDRRFVEIDVLERLHQEDFCQALGIVSEMKYETEGGPTLKTCFDLLRRISSKPVVDLQHLLDAVIFNYLIGNNDAHGKNFSILYNGGSASFSPLYDTLSTVYYQELSPNMAMKIGGEFHSEKINKIHFEKLAEDAGLAKPRVVERLSELAEKITINLDKVPIRSQTTKELTQLITGRCERVLKLL
ncbi:MAG: type II toxin-antitoxin system HipA family toxin [Rickettsiales bacterium]